MSAACATLYNPRQPRESPLYRLVDDMYDKVKGSWEERFEHAYGFWRGFVDDVVLAFQACGDFEGGFARVYCDECRAEYLVAFSCSQRGFCTSCAAKRGAFFGALLREEIVEEVGHCLWTFTLPKLLRPYFRNRRELLGKLRLAGWETVRDLIAEVTDKDVRPGMVAAIHTSSSDLRWHPHLHCLASRGGWDRDGVWHPVPYVDTHAAEMLFRKKVLTLLSGEGLLSEERIELLDSWKHGHTVPRGWVSAHNAVTLAAGDHEGLERLGRYLLRPPLSVQRMEVDKDTVHYRHKRAPYPSSERFDAQDFLARLLMHIPAPRLHLLSYSGEYSSVVRARRREAAKAQDTKQDPADDEATDDDLPSTAERRRLRRGWAQMIRRIYEVDPLTCRCGAQMRIISFILDPRVVTKILVHLADKGAAQGRAPPSEALAS